MKNIYIPPTVEEYQADLMSRAFPDERIAEHDFYRRLIGWIIDERTPLLYDQTHPDEQANLSINFNWLATRDYRDSPLGPEPTMVALYALHEFVHMTRRLPTRPAEVTAAEYAEDFALSEYRASNESEIQVHYRIPELRDAVFPGMRLAVDLMKERGIGQQPAHLLNQLRAILVEHDIFDHLLGDDPDVQAELTRLKRYGGNRTWASRHYELVRQRFAGLEWPQSQGLSESEYEPTVTAYEPQLTQERYQTNVIRNVRFAYAMCGLEVPFIATFTQAIEAAKGLEGHHALVTN